MEWGIGFFFSFCVCAKIRVSFIQSAMYMFYIQHPFFSYLRLRLRRIIVLIYTHSCSLIILYLFRKCSNVVLASTRSARSSPIVPRMVQISKIQYSYVTISFRFTTRTFDNIYYKKKNKKQNMREKCYTKIVGA